jgi:methionyl-tRNA formyltransferase
MPYNSILVVSDNEVILTEFVNLLDRRPELKHHRMFSFACHPMNEDLKNKQINNYTVKPQDIKSEYVKLSVQYDLIISAHCKQIFPAALVNSTKCINIHPGYNPYNRGWYPQVFAIINGSPLGATIHEIDESIDHGKIIDRERVVLKSSDTSLTAYNRVQAKEFELLERNIQDILTGAYKTIAPEIEGNVNSKNDFNNLCEIDLEENLTFKQAIDRLRSLTHPPFKNAYFIDPETKQKIWVEIRLDTEGDE